ncbi:MAG: S9 family peptidase, partial [Dehalococcoidia bacterium]
MAQTFAPRLRGNSTLRLVGARPQGARSAEVVDPAFDRHTTGDQPPLWLDGRRMLALAVDRGSEYPVIAKPDSPTQTLHAGRHTATSISVAADGRTAAVVRSTTTEPAEVYRIDLVSEEATQLTHLNEGWRHDVQTSSAQHLAVRTAPQVEVDTWIMPPHTLRAGRKYPVLLSIHGGPFGQYGEAFFDEFQVYAAAGYGVVFCNPRGSSGQDSEFARALVGRLGEVDYEDVMAAFEAALKRMPWADHRRLGILGGSYGGFLTSWAVGHTDRFAAACSERAVNDWYLMQGTSDIGATFNQRYLGERATTYDDVDAVLRQSPTTYARDIRTPLLILHAEDDLRCPISQAEALFVVLRKLRRDVEFVRVPDEDHELSRNGSPAHRVERFRVILDFFARKMPPG